MNKSTKEKLFGWKAITVYFVILKLVTSLLPISYGIFRDEFLYISMSDHLGLGYLEVPPLPALVLAGIRFLFGTSIFALHIAPALLGSAVIIITAMTVKRLGGEKFALVLALAAVALAPMFVSHDSTFTYDAFDQLFWTLSIYFIVMLINTQRNKYWIYFGVSAGFGLLSKITMLYLGLGVFLALLLTKERKKVFTKQFLLAGLIALLIASPFIVWQIKNGFPLLEYLKNYTAKVNKLGPVEFMLNQVLTLNPFSVFIWVAGLIYFLFNQEGKKYRTIGLAYAIIAVIMMVQQTKYYLLSAYYPVLFAGGAVFIGKGLTGKKLSWIKPAYASLIVVTGLLFLPMARPILDPETYIEVTNKIGMGQGVAAENLKSSQLPQQYADMFGWENLTQNVAKVYNALSDDEKKSTCILAANYGEAGAIHYYKDKYSLPDPISGHNIFYLWGPGDATGQIMIIVGYDAGSKQDLEKYFDSVTVINGGISKYAMPYENNSPIFLCRNIKVPLKDAWKSLKHFG